MATPEQVQVLLQRIAELTNALAAGRQQGGGSTKLIDMRHCKLAEFKGGHAEFDEWSFSFKRTIRAICPRAYEMLNLVESQAVANEDTINDMYQGALQVDPYSVELFDLLCQTCRGEALAVIRTVADMKGLTAWHKLFTKYNPKTMARAIRLVGVVTNPPKIRELKDAEAALDKWEEHVKLLQKDFNETFSETVKVGIVTSMMPLSVQEYVYTSVGNEMNYETIIQRIRSVISNKVAMAQGPVPMDVGRVAGKEDEYEEEYGEEYDEVDAVGNVQCHSCGGWGHYRRDCPNSKGKGKGATPKGKGKGKAQQKGTWKGAVTFGWGKRERKERRRKRNLPRAVLPMRRVRAQVERVPEGCNRVG